MAKAISYSILLTAVSSQDTRKGISISFVCLQFTAHGLHSAVSKKRMRVCLPCLECYILGHIEENNFSKNNCMYPTEKLSHIKKEQKRY